MIDNIVNRIRSITESNLYNWVEEYIEANKSRLVTDIQNRLKRGDSVHDVNDVIGEYKSVAYMMFKQRMNPLAGGSVDLFLTGDLQRFLTIEKRSKNIFKIYSKDSKYKMLADKYGKEQFGLTEEQNTELMTDIHTYLIEKIFEKILK